jgi:glycosyltransferase involved in cell wall biosynthesis
MKLVFITQTLDPDDPALAQTLDLVGALAARVEELRVVTRHLRWDAIPTNVGVRHFDASSRAGRTLAFERAVAGSVAHADAVLVHMVPQFLTLAAPLARLRRVPLLLWYTHWHAGRSLRIATSLADRVLSVDRTSFPLSTSKLRPIGHAIDVETFTAKPSPPHDGPMRLLALGRTARWKGLGTLLEALSLVTAMGVDATLEVRGPSLTPDEVAHRAELAAIAESDARLDGRVTIAEPIARAQLPALIAAADAVVSPNEPRSGSTLDKAVFEAAACARPVVSTNPAFASLLDGVGLPLLAAPGDPAALAEVLAGVAAADADKRAAVGAELRRRIVAQHSVDHWADAVIGVVGEVRSSRGG